MKWIPHRIDGGQTPVEVQKFKHWIGNVEHWFCVHENLNRHPKAYHGLGHSKENSMIKDLLRRPAFWYLLLVLAAMGWVSNMDYEDAILQQHHYCKMVASGYWPDYDETYKAECPQLGYPAVPRAYRAATLGPR